jgi:methylenetetrahydrofolate reductase (NADPH)
MRAGSDLEKVLEAGRFAVTAEVGPPKSASAESVVKICHDIKGSADAYNLTDNQTAMARMSSIACAVVLLKEGLEPVIQMTCRDRNRIAMQSDILGASALGVRNVLCISGDHQTFGNQREAKNVYDLDSIQQLMVFKRMRDEGQVWSGDPLEVAPRLYLGAAANPFADPFEFRVTRLAKKVKAGADFIQTQSIYDMDRFERWMGLVRARGLHEKVHILAGVMPLKSHKVALYMKNRVSGMIVPDAIVDRMRQAKNPKSEGVQICMEQIEHLKGIEGVHGVHIMAVQWEEKVPEIVRGSGLLPRIVP